MTRFNAGLDLPLSFDDGLHLCQGSARFENIPSDNIALATAYIGVEFEDAPGQLQGFLAQVTGCEWIIIEHLHYISRFKHRANAPADGLAAIGNDHD